MTSQDYEAIAEMLRSQRLFDTNYPGYSYSQALDDMATRLADYMEQDNPSFVRSKFIRAGRAYNEY